MRRAAAAFAAAALVAVSNGCAVEDGARNVAVSTMAQLTAAIRTARPGDRIEIAPGQYKGYLLFTPESSGTAAKPVVVTARDGPGTVVIDGDGATVTVKFNAAAHIRLEKLDITGGSYHGVFFDRGAHDIVVRGNRVFDNHRRRPMDTHAEIKGSGRERSTRITIENNEIFHTEHPPGGNFQGIDCNYCSDFRIAGNYLHDIRNPTSEPYSHFDRGSCIQMKSDSRDTVIEGNRVARCHIGIVLGGEGLASPENIDGIVRNNVVTDSAEIGIAVVNATNGHVVHNTLFGNAISIRLTRDSRNLKSRNSVAVMNNVHEGALLTSALDDGLLSGNRRIGRGDALHIFRDVGTRDFHLTRDATALIDRAIPVGISVPTDFDGTSRPDGARADIGAFEYRP